MFIFNNNVDIILISETHFIKKGYFRMPSYSMYHTTHRDGTAHDDIAIIIKNNIRHHELNNFKSLFLY